VARRKEADNRVLFARLQRVWTDIAHGEWLSLLAEAAPEGRFIRYKHHIKGGCPFHDDSTPSFIVTPEKGIAKCFGCHKIFVNPVHLIAALQKCSYGDAILFARKRFGLKASIPDALFEKVRDHEVYQRHKATLMRFFSKLLFQSMGAYANNTLDADGLSWAQPVVEYLVKRRLGESAPNELVSEEDQPNGTFDQYGVWQAICGQQLLGVFPPKAFVENEFGVTSEEFKFYNSYFGKYTDGFNYLGFLVFPYNDAPNSICRFKMREPTREKPGMAWVDDAYEAEMGSFRGFYGLAYYRTFLSMRDHGDDGPKEGHVALLHEGEFDALASIAQQIRRSSEDFVALALGGASSQPVDRLADLGVLRAWLVGDRDKGGENFARRVMNDTKSKTITFRVFQWPDEYVEWTDPTDPGARIKDPDDAIKKLGYPRFARYACDVGMYWHAHEWCYDQAGAEIRRGNPEDIPFVNRIAKDWGSVLRDAQSSAAFCDAIAKNFGLDATILKRDIWTKDEKESTFIERLMRTVIEKFHVVGVQNAESRKRLLVLWHKDTRAIETVVLNDEKGAETFVARYYGPIYNFVKDHVGEPGFIVGDDGDDTPFDVSMRSKRYREYLNQALLSLAQDRASIDTSNTKSQGIHMLDHSAHHIRSYMVNGRDVFRIQHDETEMRVTRLEGPSDEGTIFENVEDAWIDSIKTEADFFPEKPTSLVDLYLQLKGMIDTGWGFRNQWLDATFLAAHVLTVAPMTVFTRQTAVIVNAEAESGKSKFTAGFIGGSGFPRINVVAHARSMQGYTAASIRQKHNNCSLCLCLEEFEDYGGNDAKSVAVRKVLELCRDLISEAAVNWSIGTTTGESKTYRLRFPLVASAIRPLRDAASLSRFVQFELVKDSSRGDPVLALLDKFSDETMKKARHDVVVVVLPHMLSLRKHQAIIEKEYAKGDKLPAHATSRFREALYPVLCMLRLLGELAKAEGRPSAVPDYRQFAYDFSESRRDQLARLKTTSENEQIFETILSSPIQTASVGDKDLAAGVTNLREMLSNLNDLNAINKTKKGVYLDVKMEWLVINWVEATQGLLYQSKYRSETPTFLKQVSERSPHHVKTEDVRAGRVLERLVSVMGPCQPIDLISVFSIKHLLDQMRDLRHAAMAVVATPTDTDKVDVDKAQAVGTGDNEIIA
jgi:hypothetical protein